MRFAGLLVTEDGQFILATSGSRTDHGEVESNSGSFPNTREVPLTAVVLKLPINAAGTITLQNDKASLVANGYLFAEESVTPSISPTDRTETFSAPTTGLTPTIPRKSTGLQLCHRHVVEPELVVVQQHPFMRANAWENLEHSRRGIHTVVVAAPVDNLRCRVLRHDAGWISVGFKNHAAIGDSVNEVPRHPDGAGLKRQRHREHVKAPRVDFHWWQKVYGNGSKEFSGYQGSNKRGNQRQGLWGPKGGKATAETIPP